jgi:hypothetical protein
MGKKGLGSVLRNPARGGSPRPSPLAERVNVLRILRECNHPSRADPSLRHPRLPERLRDMGKKGLGSVLRSSARGASPRPSPLAERESLCYVCARGPPQPRRSVSTASPPKNRRGVCYAGPARVSYVRLFGTCMERLNIFGYK